MPLPLILVGSLGGNAPNANASAVPRVRNIYVDPLSNRFALTSRGNLRMTADLESIAQGIRLALGFYLGEWFLDEDKGVPWREQVLVKNPSLVLVNETIRTAIESVEGVASVDSINMDLNTKTRALTGTAVATGDLGRLSITFVEPSQVGV